MLNLLLTVKCWTLGEFNFLDFRVLIERCWTTKTVVYCWTDEWPLCWVIAYEKGATQKTRSISSRVSHQLLLKPCQSARRTGFSFFNLTILNKSGFSECSVTPFKKHRDLWRNPWVCQKALWTIRSHGTESVMLGCKLRSGTFKTKENRAGLVRVPLFWKYHVMDRAMGHKGRSLFQAFS